MRIRPLIAPAAGPPPPAGGHRLLRRCRLESGGSARRPARRAEPFRAGKVTLSTLIPTHREPAVRRRRGGAGPLPLAALALLALAALPLRGQEGEVRPRYVLPVISEGDRQAYEDFRKFVAERAWSRAFRSIQDQMQREPEGLMPAEADRASLPWREQIWTDLAALPPEGRRAFRLFHDARVERALRGSEGLDLPSRRRVLEDVFWTGFLASKGGEAAYALALLELGEGRPARAARYLRAVADHLPEADLDRAALWTALAVACHRSGDGERFREAAGYASGRFGDRSVAIEIPGEGLIAGAVDDVLEALDPRKPAGGVGPSPPDLELQEGELRRIWTRSLLQDHPDGATPPKHAPGSIFRKLMRGGKEDGEKDDGAVDAARVALACDGRRLAVNRDGTLRVFDPATGGLVWKTGRRVPAAQEQGAVPFAVFAGDDLYCSTRTPASGARAVLECHDASAAGDQPRWSTANIEEFKRFHLLSEPLAAGGQVLIAAVEEQVRQLFLLAIDRESGALLKEVPLGAPASARSSLWSWRPRRDAGLAEYRPRLAVRDDQVLVMTDGGAVCAVSPAQSRLLWALPYEFLASRIPGGWSPSSMAFSGDLLLFRSQGSRRLIALDAEARKTAWQRSVPADSSLAGIDDRHYYMLGAELIAIARDGRRLVWSRVVPASRGVPSMLVTESRIALLSGAELLLLEKSRGDVTARMLFPEFKDGGARLHRTACGSVFLAGAEQMIRIANHSQQK